MSNKRTKNHLSEDQESPLIIYCKEWCDYLRELVHLLREKQWSFTFIDLRFDTEKAKQLVSELGNPLILPVLAIDGTYYEKPPISTVTDILDLNGWKQQFDRKFYGTRTTEA